MTRTRRLSLGSLLALALVLMPVSEIAFGGKEKPTAVQVEFFEKQVRPLLAQHCYECHSTHAKKLQAGLFVDSRTGLLRGGESGPAIVPKDIDGSLLIEAVRYESFQMPPHGKLPPKDVETLQRWVGMGAPWPDEAAPTVTDDREAFDLQKRKSEHWVWQAVQPPRTPEVSNVAWPRTELDRFVLARLEETGLQPARDVDRNALVRRIYFDLIGLPPTSDQVQRFLDDERPGSIKRLVDHLLKSPHFGERWGRHWLDLVRYAESRGHEFDNDARNAYQYRDYVIRTLNADVPYDQMVREHIAGDLLDPPRLHPTDGFNESVLGTGFWFLGEWVHSPVDIRRDEADRFDNMIDVMSKTFLGVTVSCARCHDHKFDAISTADYYALTGFLQSSDYRQVRFESMQQNQRIAEDLAKLDDNYQTQIEETLGVLLPRPESFIPSAEKTVASNIVVDFGEIGPDDFMQDGFTFGSRPRLAGEPIIVDVSGKPSLQFTRRSGAVSDSFWSGLKSISEKGIHNQSRLSRLHRSGRTLRTPTFALRDGHIHCRVRGSGHVVACVDSYRLIAGPLHGETIQKITPTGHWVRLNLSRYVGHRLHLEFTPDQDAQLEVSFVVEGASSETLKELEQRELAVETEVNRYHQAVAQSLTEDTEMSERVDELVRAWATKRALLRNQIRLESRVAMAMMDGSGEDDYVLIRGNASNPGDIVPRRFLTAIAGGQTLDSDRGSGRLELAQQINDPANPLTSRVIVNRIWHHLMGRGLVPTTDDFGVLGQRPTHPNLLDHLALRFLADGRSIKQLIRYVMLSRTYQMSSHADPGAVVADPKNMLWHHRPPKRLEGEAIRDALLTVSGQLDESMFGEPVPIHLTSFMEGRGRPGKNGPWNGNGRRSIYIAVRRNFLSPFMLAFDTPVPFSTMGRRNVSNVPSQALILMNDPFVASQTDKWARRSLQVVPSDVDPSSAAARIEWMYMTAFARMPGDQELQVATRYLSDQARIRGTTMDDVTLWAELAHALVNTKEFIFLR